MFIFADEKELVEYLTENFNTYFDFDYIAREYKINKKGNRVDLIGEDEDRIYLIEVKRDFIDSESIKQIRQYINMYKQNTSKKLIGIVAAPKIKNYAYELISDSDNIEFKILNNVECVNEWQRLHVLVSDLQYQFLKRCNYENNISIGEVLRNIINDEMNKRKEAAQSNGVTINAIKYALKHGTKSAGYTWKYTKS